MSRFLMHGFGVLDAPTSFLDGNRWKPCPHYRVWNSMLVRCYSEKDRPKLLSYAGCTIDERWRLFSDFKEWRVSQDWKGKQLDKDLLVPGNKVYGPDTCAMVSLSLNSFLVRDGHPDLLMGVIRSASGKFKPIRYTKPYCKMKIKQQDFEFDTENEAHQQWLRNKHEIALIHASHESDPRVVDALKTRWSNGQENQ